MKLLFLTPSYPPMIGGGERYAHALALRAAAAGHEVTVVTSDVEETKDFWEWRPSKRDAEPTTTFEGRVEVIRCPAVGIPGDRSGLMLWRKSMVLLSDLPGDHAHRLAQMARRVPSLPELDAVLGKLHGFDLVHGFNLSWENALISARRYARDRDVPFIVTPFAHLGVNVQDRVAKNNTMEHQLLLLADSDAVLALTLVEREGLIGLGVPEDRVYSVGSGFRPSPASADIEATLDIMETLGLADPLVLFIGRVSRDKGAIHASEAVRQIWQDQAGTPTLALVGHIESDYRRYYRHLPVVAQSHIRPLGVVDEETKQALLSKARMLVLPSKVDSFGIVFLEAWGQGKPVIGARAGGIPAVIEDGVDGLLVDWGRPDQLADAILRLLEDDEMAQAMGEAGRAKVSRDHTWEAVYRRVERIYQRTLQDHPTGQKPRTPNRGG